MSLTGESLRDYDILVTRPNRKAVEKYGIEKVDEAIKHVQKLSDIIENIEDTEVRILTSEFLERSFVIGRWYNKKVKPGGR